MPLEYFTLSFFKKVLVILGQITKVAYFWLGVYLLKFYNFLPGIGCVALARTLSNHLAQLEKDFSLVTSKITMTTDGSSHLHTKENQKVTEKKYNSKCFLQGN